MSFESAQREYDDMEPEELKETKTPRHCWTHDNQIESCPLFESEDHIELDFEYDDCETCGNSYK
jgi:hypothetical protein